MSDAEDYAFSLLWPTVGGNTLYQWKASQGMNRPLPILPIGLVRENYPTNFPNSRRKAAFLI
jgi:hypothetical protein